VINNLSRLFLGNGYCLSIVDDIKMGSIDDGDPNTTNIYLGNLPTKVSLVWVN
jgi:hypothetical protein